VRATAEANPVNPHISGQLTNAANSRHLVIEVMEKITASQLKNWIAIIICLLLLGFIFADQLYKGYLTSFPVVKEFRSGLVPPSTPPAR
jgi:hypothetical protein